MQFSNRDLWRPRPYCLTVCCSKNSALRFGDPLVISPREDCRTALRFLWKKFFQPSCARDALSVRRCCITGGVRVLAKQFVARKKILKPLLSRALKYLGVERFQSERAVSDMTSSAIEKLGRA